MLSKKAKNIIAIVAVVLTMGLAVMLSKVSDPMVGYSVATGYEKNLRTTITASQTTIPVTSLALKDGTDLDIDMLGGKVFLSIEPGSAREEIVMCTGINTSSLNFTSCTRGLAFSGTSTAGVAANQKAHNAGSKVVMSNVHYVYEQYADVNNKDQTLAGEKTWTGIGRFTASTTYFGDSIYLGDDTTAYNKNLYARNGDANYAYLRYNEALSSWQWSANGVDAYSFTSSTFTVLTASSTMGIGVTDSKIFINASSTLGMAFDSTGYLYLKSSSTAGIATDSNGFYTSVALLSTAGIASTSPTAGTIPIAKASGLLDDTWLEYDYVSTSVTSAVAFVLDTVYQNTSAKPLMISAQVIVTGWAAGDFFANGYIGASTSVSNTVSYFRDDCSDTSCYENRDMAFTLTFVVPPSWYYKISSTGGTANTLSKIEI